LNWLGWLKRCKQQKNTILKFLKESLKIFRKIQNLVFGNLKLKNLNGPLIVLEKCSQSAVE
jgi:hypothetical protein